MPFLMSMIPSLFGGGKKSGGISGIVSGLTKGLTGGNGTKRRRRRARLTSRDMSELMQIKNILGRTAAAEAIGFYLRRG